MTAKLKLNPLLALLAAIAAVLLAAGPAAGQAVEEYFPQVPNSGGDDRVGVAEGSFANPALAALRSRARQRQDEAGRSGSSPPVAALGASRSNDRTSGLLNPVILLLIAGVLTISTAMILVRRKGGTGPGEPAPAAHEAPPPTPDGEIDGSGGPGPAD